MLALPPIPPTYDVDAHANGWVTSSSIGVRVAKAVEQAGSAFHSYQLRQLGLTSGSTASSAPTSPASETPQKKVTMRRGAMRGRRRN